MHAVLGLKHLEERIPCCDQSRYYRVTATSNLALVLIAQLLVVTYQDKLIGIRYCREDINLTSLSCFIDDDFLKADVLKSTGLCRLAGRNDYGVVR